jgi:hypothetical protein
MRWLALGIVAGLAACGSTPALQLTDTWPAHPGSYDAVTRAWTRDAQLHADYQEVLDVVATFESADWLAAHAVRDANLANLTGPARVQAMAQAQAAAAGPYEIELMVTTWDRRENDLDRGKNSVWRVVLVDDLGHEIQPIEIVKDRRPPYTVRAEFPALGDFAVPYIVRFPRTPPVFGPQVRAVKLRMSSERGGIELTWAASG